MSLLGLIPILKDADRDLVFEQGSRSCGGHAARPLESRGTQEAISRRGTYGEQLVAALLRKMQMSVSLKCFDESG